MEGEGSSKEGNLIIDVPC